MTSSLDDTLLDYYQRELAYLRNSGAQFAERFPKIAHRLELSRDECPDPHVERLLEGFAFLAARLHRTLDDEYSQLADALLEHVSPYALRPIPSASIIQFAPDPTKGVLGAGYPIPRGTALHTHSDHGDTVHFRTSQLVTLWPLEITEAELLLNENAQRALVDGRARAALRLRLRSLKPHALADLAINKLSFYLAAPPTQQAALYDLLIAHAYAISITQNGTAGLRLLPGVLPQALGFGADEALLPDVDTGHPAHRLLTEYFAFPEKFAFVEIGPLPRMDTGQDLDILIALDKAPPTRLSLQPKYFALGCTPVVNLFPRTSEPLRPDAGKSEYRLVGDAHRERNTEIYAVRRVHATDGSQTRELPGYFDYRHGQARDETSFWHARRVASLRSDLPGTDILLSFVDVEFDLSLPVTNTLTAELLCTNRRLAENLPAGALLSLEMAGPVARASLLHKPSPQTMPQLSGSSRWRLVSQLSLNHLSLNGTGKDCDALKEILELHDFNRQRSVRRQINGLSRVTTEPTTAHFGHDAWRGWRNGLEVRIELTQESFVGASPVLFSGVLAHFFALYVHANSFVRTVLTDNDKEIKTWEPLPGAAPLL